MNINQHNSINNFFSKMKDWWIFSVPVSNKLLFNFSLLICVLCLFSQSIFLFLCNSVSSTLYKFQIFRIITATYSHENLFHFFFSILSLIYISIEIEKKYGTVAFTIDLFSKAIFSQIFYLVIMLIFGIFFRKLWEFKSSGLWMIAMIYLVQKLFNDPEEKSNLMGFPLFIKNKYHPFIILILITCIFGIQSNIFIGFIFGLLEFKIFNGICVKLSKESIENCESSFLFRWLTHREDFIFIENNTILGFREYEKTEINSFTGNSAYLGESDLKNPFTEGQNNVEQNIQRTVSESLTSSMPFEIASFVFGLIKLIVCIVFITSFNNKCSGPIQEWFILMIIHDFVFSIYSVANIYYTKQHYNNININNNNNNNDNINNPIENDQNDIEEPFFDDENNNNNNNGEFSIDNKKPCFGWMREINSCLYIVLFVWGHFILFFSPNDCENNAHELWVLMLVLILFAYIFLFSPIFLLIALCLCTPCLILFASYFGNSQRPSNDCCTDKLFLFFKPIHYWYIGNRCNSNYKKPKIYFNEK